jgi:uncharacterized protein YkvS
MDEEVINDLYSRAVSKGYRKDRDQFVNLLHSDQEVLNDMYSYVQSKGYKKTIDDFSGLIGKNPKQPIEQPTEQVPQEVEQPKKKDSQGGFTNSLATVNRTLLNIPADLTEMLAVGTAWYSNLANKVTGGKDVKAEDIVLPIGAARVSPFKIAQEYKEKVKELTPIDEDFEGSFAGQLSAGAGQIIGMLMSGGGSAPSTIPKMAKNAKTAEMIVQAGKDLLKGMGSRQGVIGGSMMGASNYEEAIRSGATEWQAQQAGVENTVVGSIFEQLPIQSMFARLAKFTPDAKVLEMAKNGAIGFGQEAITESVQTAYENMSANRIYEANRSILDGVGEAAAVGGTLGFAMNVLVSALTGKRAKTNIPEEQEILDKAIKETEDKIEVIEKNNEVVKETVEKLEKTKYRTLNDGDSNLDFIETEDGLEYTEDGLDEKSANGIINKLATKYPNIEFSLVDNTPEDTYALADFKVVGKPKNAPVSEYRIGGNEVPKEMASVKIDAAENLDELKEISITNDSELQSALQNKVKQLSKPVEEVKAEETPVVEPEIVPETVENASIQEQPTIEEPRGEKPTVVENVSEEPTVEGTDTEVPLREYSKEERNKPVLDSWEERTLQIDADKNFTDTNYLEVGDIVMSKDRTVGFVKKINPKKVIIETAYGGYGNNDVELIDLSIDKSDVTNFKKPKKTEVNEVKLPQIDIENQSEAVEEKLSEEVVKTVKSAVKIQYLSAKELVGANDPIDSKSKQESIKQRHKKILQLIDCLNS